MTQAERLFGQPRPIQYPPMDLATLYELREWLRGEMAVRKYRVRAQKLLVAVMARIMEEEK